MLSDVEIGEAKPERFASIKSENRLYTFFIENL